MTSPVKRNIFSINNKYQMQIVFLITAPFFAITVALLIAAYFMNSQLSSLVSNQSYLMIGPCIAQWFYAIVCFIFISLFVFFLLAFKTAYDLVNPFSRIILEVDEILITGSKRTIVVRPDDELANEVAVRFNKLVAQIPVTPSEQTHLK